MKKTKPGNSKVIVNNNNSIDDDDDDQSSSSSDEQEIDNNVNNQLTNQFSTPGGRGNSLMVGQIVQENDNNDSNNIEEEEEDNIDETEETEEDEPILGPPPWDKRSNHLREWKSSSSRRNMSSSHTDSSKEDTIVASNYHGNSTTTSSPAIKNTNNNANINKNSNRSDKNNNNNSSSHHNKTDDNSSAVTFQLQHENNSQYTESNSLYNMSESDEGYSSHLSTRQHHRLLESSTAASSASVSVVAHQEQQQQILVDPSAALNFIMEHRIFLKAALDLLTERDRHAPELGMMDPIILKAGALKKASHLMNGVWKVKYVEIRRGMFSYYDNAVSNTGSGDGELLLRKNIPLEASTCTCRAVKLHQKALNFSPGGAIFELNSNNNNTKRLWMATSREERQAWLQAINNAMVGGSVTRGDSLVDHRGIVRTVSGRSPFKNDLRKYLKMQSSMKNAKNEYEYLLSLRELLMPNSLHVPVKWIAKSVGNNDNSTGHNSTTATGGAFTEETVAMSVDQLWRDLQRDTVNINDVLYRGDSSHGPERILGALTRQILNVGQSSEVSSGISTKKPDLRESKALVYARDLLLAGNRTRSGGDSYYCVNALCSNSELVVVVPSGTEVEPISIKVTEDDSEDSLHARFNDKTGWIKTRNKLQRTWQRHFFVLSEGTLSYYEGASPRPHGLQGQRVLTDASLAIVKKKTGQDGNNTNRDEFLVTISHKDGSTRDRYLLFDSDDKLLDWVYALECFIHAKSYSEPAKQQRTLRRRPSNNTTLEEPQNVISSLQDILDVAQRATIEHGKSIDLDTNYIESCIEKFSQRATSALRVSVKACTEYNVCTIDPDGDIDKDIWACIRAHFLQAFRITGGPNGRITRGEEIVRLSVIKCLDIGKNNENNNNHVTNNNNTNNPENIALSPKSPGGTMRARLNRRIFRNPSTGDEEIPVAD